MQSSPDQGDRANEPSIPDGVGRSSAPGSSTAVKGATTTDLRPAKRHGPKPIVLILVLAVAGAVFYFIWNATHQLDRTKLHVSGRVEGYETNIGAKIAGRVDFIAVREGDAVKTDQLIVRLSDEDIQAQLRGAKARLQKAEADRRQAADQLDVVKSQIEEAQLNERQSVEDAKGRIFQAQSNVASAQANLAQTQAQVTQAKADWKLANLRKTRYQKLAQRGAVAQDDADQADTTEATTQATVESRQSTVESSRKLLAAAQGALTQARSNQFNPGIRNAQLAGNRVQLTKAAEAVAGADHDIANAKAEVEQIQANIAYLNILSPIDGIVTARPIEPGAVVAAGQTVLALINLNTVYLRGYIPEGEAGRIRVGQKANVFLDSAPKTALPSHISEIDPEASFTPENIYFKEDRVQQVFGLKIAIENPGGFAKPGMPADADIMTDSGP
jgi:HlyD family secretion protein